MAYDDLSARLAGVRELVDAALERSGRAGDEVRIVAVTKTHPASAVTAAGAAGLVDVGENRVKELEDKVGLLGRYAARWHLIGPVQRKKVRRALPLFDLLHSLDSVRLAEKLSEEATAAGGEVRALVQVNASGEESKNGFSLAELLDAVGTMSQLPALRLEGLMTMAPFTDDVQVLRKTFAATRRSAEEVARQVPEFSASYLSMGMSNDFEIAVEEGSTMLRLGTILLGERER